MTTQELDAAVRDFKRYLDTRDSFVEAGRNPQVTIERRGVSIDAGLKPLPKDGQPNAVPQLPLNCPPTTLDISVTVAGIIGCGGPAPLPDGTYVLVWSVPDQQWELTTGIYTLQFACQYVGSTFAGFGFVIQDGVAEQFNATNFLTSTVNNGFTFCGESGCSAYGGSMSWVAT